jgi:hypothetical protein
MGLIDKVIRVSKKVKNNRDEKDIAIKLAEESGEVMGVVSIMTGLSSYKPIKENDLVDELVDVFINIVDLGFKVYGKRFRNLFHRRLRLKLKKWEEKYNLQKESDEEISVQKA